MTKPTKYEIRQYLTEFIQGLDGYGLLITDEIDLEAELDRITEFDYPVLRELFEENKEVKEND